MLLKSVVLILDNLKRRSLWNLSVVNLLNFTLLNSKQNMWQRKLKTQDFQCCDVDHYLMRYNGELNSTMRYCSALRSCSGMYLFCKLLMYGENKLF